MKTNNQSLRVLHDGAETVADYEGICGELADAVLHLVSASGDEDGQILYIDLEDHPEWRYHMVPVVDGIVHCAWFSDLMLPPSEYVEKAFSGFRVEWSVTNAETGELGVRTCNFQILEWMDEPE